MSLHLFDTATRTLRALEPLRTGEVGIYVCGATVQASPHVGHLRTDVAFDVLVRWLRRSGLAVTLVRNVTDIDDKILIKAAEGGVPWWAWAQRFEREFAAARDALGLVPATYEPRATGHVTDMVELMTALVDKGHAYTTADGDVWFDVRSWPDYGSLTNQRLEDVGASPDESTSGKRDSRDFALWKATKPSDPPTASWPTPFGRGRPGWHLECSAMAHRYLGDTFDIHGGGLDLRFPHHENEQAQSRAAGRDFARLWMHSAWVTQSGTKMSKSLGNTLTAAAVLERARPVVVRWALAAVHYRSMLEWTPDTLDEATATWERIEGFVARAQDAVGGTEDVTTAPLPERFTAAMDDDLNVPAALAVVHDHVRQGNSALAAGGPEDVIRDHVVAVRAMLDALGLDPVAWAGQGDGGREAAALDALVAAELEVRTRARAERDWAAADAVRDRLAAAGVVVEDSPEGPRWSLTREQED